MKDKIQDVLAVALSIILCWPVHLALYFRPPQRTTPITGMKMAFATAMCAIVMFIVYMLLLVWWMYE